MPTATSTITTSWTGPPAITGLSRTVMEEYSHIMLNWDASTQTDTDFDHYSVHRRDFGTVEWTLLAEISSKTVVEHVDIYTGVGQHVEYKVTQWKKIPGDTPIESEDGDIVDAMLESDVWFVIGEENFMHDTTRSFELPVAGEKHTRPIQQEIFEPIVKNRKKIARGNTLGHEGSLTVRYTTDERNKARDQITYLAETRGPHVLKSPFGDVWRVEFDAPDFRYVGGGHMDVEIGWVEVLEEADIRNTGTAH